jgi:glutamine amidotransferase
MIGIVNYGLGNLKSIQSIISHVGGESRILNKSDEMEGISKLILPGVGAFDHGMQGLNNGNWIAVLNKLVLEEKVPILGICLGMQLMCSSSDEGVLPGLGWINAEVRKITFPEESELKIPHMGWNILDVKKDSPLFDNDGSEQRFYFVHSFHVVCHQFKDVLATTHHGFDITSSFQHDNIYGVQFHPEKSHKFGKYFFKKFIEL